MVSLESLIDYLAERYQTLTTEERENADRWVEEGKSREFYEGMIEANCNALKLFGPEPNPTATAISMLSTRAAYLYRQSFPSEI